MEANNETSVKGQSKETACFLLFTSGHILQRIRHEAIDPNVWRNLKYAWQSY